jgi:hypothetical protein
MNMHADGPAATMLAALAQGMEAVYAEQGCDHCGGECAQVFTDGAAMLGMLAVWEG